MTSERVSSQGCIPSPDKSRLSDSSYSFIAKLAIVNYYGLDKATGYSRVHDLSRVALH